MKLKYFHTAILLKIKLMNMRLWEKRILLIKIVENWEIQVLKFKDIHEKSWKLRNLSIEVWEWLVKKSKEIDLKMTCNKKGGSILK